MVGKLRGIVDVMKPSTKLSLSKRKWGKVVKSVTALLDLPEVVTGKETRLLRNNSRQSRVSCRRESREFYDTRENAVIDELPVALVTSWDSCVVLLDLRQGAAAADAAAAAEREYAPEGVRDRAPSDGHGGDRQDWRIYRQKGGHR
eukprot:567937-Prorocentrum_minimum.AAC.1